MGVSSSPNIPLIRLIRSKIKKKIAATCKSQAKSENYSITWWSLSMRQPHSYRFINNVTFVQFKPSMRATSENILAELVNNVGVLMVSPFCKQVSWENLLRSTRHEHSSTTLGWVYTTMDYGLFLIWVHGSPQKKGDSTWKNGTLSYQPNPDLSSMFSRHPRISAASQETFDSWKLPDLRACGGRLLGFINHLHLATISEYH